MVDPDNRRPVDYAARVALLARIDGEGGERSDAGRGERLREWFQAWPDGRIKLALIAALLRHRAAHAELYAEGEYVPLAASGSHAEQLGAYLRRSGSEAVLIAFARHPRRIAREGWGDDTVLPLPESLAGTPWRDVLTGVSIAAASQLTPAALFAHLPVAVLRPDAAPAPPPH
jgi:(1->4)-alpha-D-glucan 1-alpha-D-glucosylmutase